MPHYVPILKGKQGELNALARLRADVLDRVSPLLEVVPWEPDDNNPERDQQELSRITERIVLAWPHGGRRLLLDAAAVDIEPSEEAAEDVERSPLAPTLLALLREQGLAVDPVVRLSASDAQLRGMADQLTVSDGGAAIRVTSEDLDDVVTPLSDLVDRTADVLGLAPEHIDLIMDFGAIADDGAMTLATRLARFILPQLAQRPWRHVVLAAGAYPANLQEVAPYVVGELPRRDAILWRNVSQLQIGRVLDYGDYAIAHPMLPIGAGYPAPPQLRYAVTDRWITMKGRRQDRRGHAQFFEICADVLRAAGDEALAANASWGDDYISTAAARATDPTIRIGPGNASTWRAIGTSHHLTFVVRSLTDRDAP